jgi:hypothetical protein
MITAAHPIISREDELQGVLGVDVTLSNISDFLRQLKAGKNGKTFVMERSGLLVASSSDSPPYDADNESHISDGIKRPNDSSGG